MATLAVTDWGNQNEPFQLDTRPAIDHRPGRNFSHDRLWKYADGHLGFHGWLRVVNRCIERNLLADSGLGLTDLPDRCWRDEYDGRVPPGEAADLAIDETVEEFGIEPP
jgi:hypothetical protein